MRGWTRTGFIVGWMLLITWGFWLAGQHTPASFAAALVGCVGFALVYGCLLDAWDHRGGRP